MNFQDALTQQFNKLYEQKRRFEKILYNFEFDQAQKVNEN